MKECPFPRWNGRIDVAGVYSARSRVSFASVAFVAAVVAAFMFFYLVFFV